MIISHIITHISYTDYNFSPFSKCSRIDNFQPIAMNLDEARLQTFVYNFKALAQPLHTQLSCTKYPISSGTDGQTDGQTDRRTSTTLYPLVFTGDKYKGYCLSNKKKIFSISSSNNISLPLDTRVN